jgi:hypothetical protein
MADTDFNAIKPVESLPNIQGVAPAQRREERRRRHKAPAEHSDPAPEELEETDETTGPNDDDAHCIDYCA